MVDEFATHRYSTVTAPEVTPAWNLELQSTADEAISYENTINGSIHTKAAENARGSELSLVPSSIATTQKLFSPSLKLVRKEPSDILFVWDFDDTIFPSSWCNQRRLCPSTGRPTCPKVRAQMDKTAKEARATLNLCFSIGADVMIITNAEEGWIEYACSAMMPTITSFLRGIKTVSARSEFEASNRAGVVSNGVAWKIVAFDKCIREWLDCRSGFGLPNLKASESQSTSDEGSNEGVMGHRVPVVFSLGDSNAEREALLKSATTFDIVGKSLKLLESPTPEQLRKQLQLFRSQFSKLIENRESMDLLVKIDNT